MHLDRWRDLVAQIKDNFQVESHESFKRDEGGGEEVEEIIFEGPLGRLKLTFITRPKVIDKKTHYSNRIGSETDVEYIYSPTEKNYQLLIERWSEVDESWLPFDSGSLGF